MLGPGVNVARFTIRAQQLRDVDRTRQRGQPRPDMFVGWGQSGLEQLARDAIDTAADRRCAHVEPNARTLGEHRGPTIIG